MKFSAKVVQGERKRKFICSFPNRSLPSACASKLKLVLGKLNAYLIINL
jgi:hypothetical protein